MKTIFYLIILITLGFGCSETDAEKEVDQNEIDALPKGAIPESMKGYEIYSWQEADTWKYTVITGTNRNKTYDEVTTKKNVLTENFVKLTVGSVATLKVVLGRMSSGTHIIWVSDPLRVEGFNLPPAVVLDEIESHCKSLNLDVYVNK
jgi:hypothetical protein